MTLHTFRLSALVALAAISLPLHSQAPDSAASTPPTISCADRSAWDTPQQPFRVYGNTYFVGSHCLSSILITSPKGDVLIDGGLPTTAALVRANIETLGFRITDVKLILNSHAHFDHAGGIAELQRASKAIIAASPASARVIEAGASGPDDPQYGELPSYPPAHVARVLADGETVRQGPIAMTAHWTPGHTRGGTTWSWISCEGKRCLHLVYADSQSPISARSFSFTHSATYSSALQDFAHGQSVIEQLPCDILLTPHPGASSLWERVAAEKSGGSPALIDTTGCKRYAESAREAVAKRVASEAGTP